MNILPGGTWNVLKISDKVKFTENDSFLFSCVHLKAIEIRAKAKMLEWLKIITVSPRSQRDCLDISGKTEDWPNLKETTRTMLTVIVIGNMMPEKAKIIIYSKHLCHKLGLEDNNTFWYIWLIWKWWAILGQDKLEWTRTGSNSK